MSLPRSVSAAAKTRRLRDRQRTAAAAARRDPG